MVNADPWKDLIKYPKFCNPPICVYPERDNCNYSKTNLRCEHMKCARMGIWFCDLQKKKADFF